MARPLRIEYSGAVYHITSRGNARGKIYKGNADRERFLGVLDSVVQRYHWLCHAYCLMDNHYHLLIETLGANLSRGMRQLNGVYTQYYNRCYRRPGHIFQGRFKAIVVEKENYLLELCRYVVLNPVRARMVERPEQWKWSSYGATVGIRSVPPFLTTDWILGVFDGSRKGVARKRYRQFVAEGMGKESPWDNLKGQTLLGEESFVEKFKELLVDKEKIQEIPREQRYAGRLTLAQIWDGEGRRAKSARDRGIYEAHVRYGYTLKEIADHLGLHYTTVSKGVKRVEDGIGDTHGIGDEK